jgi:DNA-binding transcriptional ArsR family regulator
VATHRRRPSLNAVGDLVLTEPRALLALAAPARLRIFDTLRRDGTLSPAALSAALGEDRTAVEAALEEFEACGLALAEDGKWRAAGRGFVFEMPDDPEGQEAARQLANAVLLQYVDLPRRWLEDDEPRLSVDWLRASGAFNARMSLTPDELRGLQAGLELLIEPYATRKAADIPDGAASVRILAYLMPEASEPS